MKPFRDAFVTIENPARPPGERPGFERKATPVRGAAKADSSRLGAVPDRLFRPISGAVWRPGHTGPAPHLIAGARGTMEGARGPG